MIGTGRIGYVVATHPEDHSVDLVMADDGTRLTGVQVATMNGSTRTGSIDLPAVPAKASKWDITKATGQDMKALVDYYGRTPIVTGFIYPQINQVLSNDPKLRVDRHQSDVISTINGNGDIQVCHPCGAYVRIAESPSKVDMTGQNADGNAAFDRNTGRQVHVRVSLAGQQVELTMSPNGNVLLTLKGDMDIEAIGHANITASSVTLDTPETTCTGNLTVQKAINVQGVGVTGSTATVTGGMHFVGGSITHNTKDIGDTHKHGGVVPGGGSSDVPV